MRINLPLTGHPMNIQHSRTLFKKYSRRKICQIVICLGKNKNNLKQF